MEKEQQFQPGDVKKLKAVRQNELGVFLDAGTGNTSDDILLHKVQQTAPVNQGDEVEVFLYKDPKGRLTASMHLPQMRLGQVARVEVINTSKDGAFVNIGAERGIFMPFAEMRGKVRIGDKVWVQLYRDKSSRLAVTMAVEAALVKASKPALDVQVGDMVTGSVYNYNDKGAFLFTTERYIAFLHNTEMLNERPKVGEEVTGRVTYLREDGRINISLRPPKEDAMSVDAEAVLAILRARGDKMPYSDDTSPEVIKQKFKLSKSAFKRAMGLLLKYHVVEQREGWTYLIEEPEEIKVTDETVE